MRKISLALLAALLPATAAAQSNLQFPQTLPANTVVGRLGIGAGPAQAVPITSLLSAASQSAANRVFAGPTSGGAGAATFRSLIAADFPQMAAATLWGNPTGTTAAPQAFTIQGLTNLTSASATLDYLLIYDHTTGTLKYVSASQIPGAAPLANNNTWAGTNAFTNNVSFTAAATYTQAPKVQSPNGVITSIRTPMDAAATIYVNGTGSSAVCGTHGTSAPQTCGIGNDSTTNGFNPSTPFATVQAAATYIAQNIDARGFSPTINLAHGINRQQFSCLFQPLIGQITFLIVGDYENPSSSTWQAPNGQYAMFIKDGCTPSVSSIAFSDQGSSLGMAYSGQGGIVDFRSVSVNNWNTGAAVFVAIDHGHINLLGADPLTTGTPVNSLIGTSYGQIFQAQYGGLINFNSQNISIPNAITIGGGQAMATVFGFGMIELAPAGTFTGAGLAGTTGKRCSYTNAYSGGTDPNTVFPGNSNCTPVNNTF